MHISFGRQQVGMKWLLCFLVIESMLSSTNADIFSSSADLAATFQLENQLVTVFSELVAKTEAKLDVVRRFIFFASIDPILVFIELVIIIQLADI